MKTYVAVLSFIFLTLLTVATFATDESQGKEIYIVKKGDTLSKIAKEKLEEANLWPKLATYNQIDDPNYLRAGQRLVIPTKSDLLTKVMEMERQKAEIKPKTLYETDFEGIEVGKKPAGWEFPSGGKWGIAHDGTRVLEQAEEDVGNCAAITGEDDWSNYIVQAEIKIEQSGDGGIFAYWQSYYASYRLRILNHNRLQLAKREPEGPEEYDTLILDVVPFEFKEGRWYIFKLEVINRESYTYLKGKIWKKGKSEPDTWMLEATDYSAGRYTNGKAGLWTNRHGHSYRGAKFDDFAVFRVSD